MYKLTLSLPIVFWFILGIIAINYKPQTFWGFFSWFIGLICCAFFSLGPYLVDKETRRKLDVEYELWCNSGSPEEKIVQSICDAILREHDWDGLPRIKVRVFTHVPDIITYFRKENIRNGRKIHNQYIKVQQECLRHLDAHEIAEDMKVALIQVWSEWTNNESPLVKETKAIEVGVRT